MDSTVGIRTDYAFIVGKGLINLTDAAFEEHFQITAENPIVGVSSRVALMNSIGQALLAQSDIAGSSGRPGNIVGECNLDSQNVKKRKEGLTHIGRLLDILVFAAGDG